MTTTLLEDALDDLFTITDRFAEVPMLMALVPFVSVFPFVAGVRRDALPNLARQISHATFDAVDATVLRQRRMVLRVVDAWAEVVAPS